MTLRSRRKRPTTVPNTPFRKIIRSLRWLTLVGPAARSTVGAASLGLASLGLASLATTGLSAEPAAPRPFTPSAQAHPLTAAHQEVLSSLTSRRSASVESSSSGRRRPAAVQLSLLEEEPDRPASRRGTIRQAAYEGRTWTSRESADTPAARVGRRQAPSLRSPSDAMSDPFGDQQTESVLLAPAFTRESQATQDGAESSDSGEAAPLEAPMNAQPEAPMRRTAPRAQPLPPQRGESDNCDRVYNDRDCCADDEICEAARERIRRSPITAVSLDISPRFNPSLRGASELPDRERSFERMNRPWRNREGEVIVRGAMTGIKNGRIVIRTEGGGEQEIPLRRLSDDDLCFFTAWWGVPNECLLGDDQYAGRNFTPLTFTWKASALCHKPLYFEEVQLERYGHTAGPLAQPVLSGAHFFLNIAVLPYRAGINPPSECMYALGYYRPGNCAPWLVPPVPLSVRGALTQSAAVLGGVYLIP